MSEETEEQEKCECGYESDSFACKIRHVQVNTANLKREREAGNHPNFGLEKKQ